MGASTDDGWSALTRLGWIHIPLSPLSVTSSVQHAWRRAHRQRSDSERPNDERANHKDSLPGKHRVHQLSVAAPAAPHAVVERVVGRLLLGGKPQRLPPRSLSALLCVCARLRLRGDALEERAVLVVRAAASRCRASGVLRWLYRGAGKQASVSAQQVRERSAHSSLSNAPRGSGAAGGGSSAAAARVCGTGLRLRLRCSCKLCTVRAPQLTGALSSMLAVSRKLL